MKLYIPIEPWTPTVLKIQVNKPCYYFLTENLLSVSKAELDKNSLFVGENIPKHSP